jgi:hypothetical protein
MKLFYFFRKEDLTGVSGTGPVVEGVQFTNGWCAVRWLSAKTSLCFYQSLDEVKAIHGHGDRTEIIVQDLAPLSKKKPIHGGVRFEILMQIIEQASRLMVLAEESNLSETIFEPSMEELRGLLNRFEKTFEKNR